MRGESTPKRKKRKNTTPKDALAAEHTKRHGKAVKKGIKQAKNWKHAILKAASVSKDKSKLEVKGDFFYRNNVRKNEAEKTCRERSVSPSLVSPQEMS